MERDAAAAAPGGVAGLLRMLFRGGASTGPTGDVGAAQSPPELDLAERLVALLARVERTGGAAEADQEHALAEAVAGAAAEAAAGDELMSEAAEALRSDDLTTAEDAFEAAAEVRETAAAQDQKRAAQAWARKAALASLRDPAVAHKAYAAAIALDPENAGLLTYLASSARRAGDMTAAETALDAAERVEREKEKISARVRFWTVVGQGDLASAQGEWTEALDLYQQARRDAGAAQRAAPDDLAWRGDLATAQGKLAAAHRALGADEEAAAASEAALDLLLPLAEARPDDPLRRRHLLTAALAAEKADAEPLERAVAVLDAAAAPAKAALAATWEAARAAELRRRLANRRMATPTVADQADTAAADEPDAAAAEPSGQPEK